MIVTLKPTRQSKQNASGWPEFYTCNFLEPGLVSYEDSGAGIAMLRKETILKMLPTFMGKPVIDKRHKDVTPEDYEKHAVGYITKVWYDDFANWAYCNFMLTDDEAKKSIQDGYSVSCAYDHVKTGAGGEWHAIKFDEEITDGIGNHLALVLTPRYEACQVNPCAMLVNSKKAIIKEGEGRKNTATVKLNRICETSAPYKEGVWWYVDVIYGDNGTTKKKFSSQQEADAWVKEEQKKKNQVVVMLKNKKVRVMCSECSHYFDRESTASDTLCPACSSKDNSVIVTIRKENKKPDRDAMFKREKKEHPEFKDEDIKKIVDDHIERGEKDDIIYITE